MRRQSFVTEASRCDFDVDVFYNRFTIDAKSILGVLSLDLARVLTVQMNGENEEFGSISGNHFSGFLHNSCINFIFLLTEPVTGDGLRT